LNRLFDHRSGSASALEPVAVQCDGGDDDQSLDDVLPDVRDPHEDEPVGEDRDDEGAHERAPDGANAAHEAGAAQDDGGNRVEFIGLAELQAELDLLAGERKALDRRGQPITIKLSGPVEAWFRLPAG
jgi:hypothetical protein